MKRAPAIEWHVERVALSLLHPYAKNPRAFTKKGMADLRKSIERFGLAEPIICNTDFTVIGGHARLLTLRQSGVEECDVYLPSRTLTEKEVEELNIRLNANTAGEWDWDILSSHFDAPDLAAWGLDVPELAWDKSEAVRIGDKELFRNSIAVVIGSAQFALPRNSDLDRAVANMAKLDECPAALVDVLMSYA